MILVNELIINQKYIVLFTTNNNGTITLARLLIKLLFVLNIVLLKNFPPFLKSNIRS